MSGLPRLLVCLAFVQTPTIYLGVHQYDIGKEVRLRGVSAISDTVAWASGAKGTIVRTSDGGTNWDTLPVPGAEALDFRDIDAIDASTCLLYTSDAADE